MIDLTPNPKQLQYWIDKISYPHSEGVGPSYSDKELACLAYRAGADYELEACCKIMEDNQDYVCGGVLRAIRRPKPPSETDQALELVSRIEKSESIWAMSELGTIRRALERLKELEEIK
jgi:hypothetical protein